LTQWEYLSYQLTQKTPSYGGGVSLTCAATSRIADGDSCNAQSWEMPNHLGTHIDFPYHFSKNGATQDHYPADFWVFKNPYLIDISPLQPGELIGQEQIDVESIPEQADILLVKTGFTHKRNDKIYWEKNPGFKPEFAEILRRKLPFVRIMGFDCISLSSYTNRDLGRIAHKAFLDHEKPILLLEDLDLSQLEQNSALLQIIVLPLRVEGSDAGPCTVIAEI